MWKYEKLAVRYVSWSNLRERGFHKTSFSIYRALAYSTRDTDIAILSVRLSVRHVPLFYENGLTYCHSFFTTRILIILVLWVSNIFNLKVYSGQKNELAKTIFAV